MKKLFVLAAIWPACVRAQSGTYTLTGKVNNVIKADWVYLGYYNGSRVTDRAQVKNGTYTFTGKLEVPVPATLRVKLAPQNGMPVKPVAARDFVTVFIQPGHIMVNSVDSFSNVQVSGSAAHDEYQKLQASLKPYNDRMGTLMKDYEEASRKGDKAKTDLLDKQYDVLSESMKTEVYLRYVQQHPGSPIALYVVNNYAGFDINAEKVEPVYNLLPPAMQASTLGRELKDKIAIARKTGVGSMAMDFTQNDTLGRPVSLSSFKGKYVLVDFWASWCGPCRRENPNVVKAFNKYRGKGFEILGVSLDQPGAKEKWVKAIHDDGLTWTHVSDLQFWGNAVARQYGIQSIPANFLLDPNGKIIGKNLRGEELDNRLAGIFGL